MSPQLIILLLQEISAQAPTIIQEFKKGNVTPEQQQELKDAVDNLGAMFNGPEWKKSTS